MKPFTTTNEHFFICCDLGDKEAICNCDGARCLGCMKSWGTILLGEVTDIACETIVIKLRNDNRWFTMAVECKSN